MEISRFLADLRRRLVRVLGLDGSARLVLAALALTAGLILVDYIFRLPDLVRCVGLVALVASLAWVVWFRLKRPLSRPMDDLTLARFTERRLGVLGGRLLSGVEGLPLNDADRAVLAEALGGDCARRLVPAAHLPMRLGVAVGALGIAILITLALPGQVLPGLQRLFVPFAGVEWARTAALTLEVDRPVVPADEPVVVSVARVRGGEAGVRLTWTDLRSGQRETRLVDGTVGKVARRQPLALTPGHWRLVAESGDALPASAEVLVVSRPALDRMDVTLAPPAYTGLPAERLSTLACSALPGSTLTFDVSFVLDHGRTVDSYRLDLGGKPLEISATATGFSGSLVVSEGGELSAVIADQDGVGPRPEPRFSLTLIQDRTPVVRLGGVRNNEAVSPRAVLALKVDARDDYGLADLRLGVNTSATATFDPEQARDLHRFEGIAGEATTRSHRVEVGTLGAPGTRVALVGIASDRNDVTGPGIGRSETIVLRIVSEEDLRADIDRGVVDALERVRQAREELAKGFAGSTPAAASARNALLPARKSGDLLQELLRRVRDNQVDPDLEQALAEAGGQVNEGATPQLARAASQGEASDGAEAADAANRQADAALAEAEDRLKGLRQEGDLGRHLAHLIQLQRALNEETRGLVRTYLVKALDETGLARFTDLAARQSAIAAQMLEIERRLLGSTSTQLGEAQDLVRREHPADRLAAAAAALAAPQDRAKADPQQTHALTAMEKLLDLLRGTGADRALAERIGRLAERQEQMVKELERGAPAKGLAERQEALRQETEEVAEMMRNQGKDADATEAMEGAQRDQQEAGQAMSEGDGSSAAREGAAAAAQLREAQRRLQGEQEQEQEQGDKPSVADVLKILRELRGIQIKVLNGSQGIHDRVGEEALDFAAKRDLEPLAELEMEIHLRLRAEVLPPLEQMPIAKRALERVSQAVERVVNHLARPALGEHGIVLETIALHEMSRLLDIVDAMPEGKPGSQEGQNGGGGQQAPFPPAAELALLAAMQDEVARRTVVGAKDVAQDQKAIADLVEMLRQASRPGSRPAILLERAGRATASADYRLRQEDRGLTTRHEQELAVLALLRVLEEAEQSQGGGQGSSSSQQSQQQQQRQQGQPQQGGDPQEGAQSQQGQGTAQSGANPENQDPNGGTGGTVVEGMAEATTLHLPPERREQLREAMKQDLPPQAIPLYRRYLELLEDE